MNNKIKVEIWSDVACPFCYIGKRKFEEGLNKFEHKEEVEIDWKSFQLMPEAKTENEINIHEMLAKRYGRSISWAKQMNDQVSASAKEVGLNFNFDKVQFTNTLDAHKLIHLAKKYNLQDKVKEKLLSAYFVEGTHIGRIENLVKLGEELGLDKDEIKKSLESDIYNKEIYKEINEGQALGLTGVPFFVFNRKYGVSGAQDSSAFLEVLNNIWKEAYSNSVSDKNSCSLEGNCV